MCQLNIIAVIDIPVASTMGRRLLTYSVVDHKSRFTLLRWVVILLPIIAAKGFIRCGMVTQNKHPRVRCRPCKTIESCRYLSQFSVGRRLITIVDVDIHARYINMAQ